MSIKKLFVFSCFVLVCLSLVIGVSAFASAEFQSADSVSASNVYENAYFAGGNVTVDGTVQKDLITAGGTVSIGGVVSRNAIIAGGTVTIKSQVGASLFVTGGTVVIDSPNVIGSTRVAGGNVTLSGNYGEDILIGGGDVILKNATIAGDVYVGAGTLTIQNSTIKGKLTGQYGELKGDDLKTQVAGTVDLKKVETDKAEDTSKKAWNYLNISWEISVILVTLVASWFLSNRNRLAIPSIKWDKTFGLDILIGFGAFVLPGIATIILMISQLFPLALLLPSIVFFEIVAAILVLPIYVGNFIKNTWNLKLSIKWAVVIGYFVLLGLSLLSNVSYLGLLSLLISVFVLAHVGFIIRTSWKATNQFLAKRKA